MLGHYTVQSVFILVLLIGLIFTMIMGLKSTPKTEDWIYGLKKHVEYLWKLYLAKDKELC